MQPRAGERPVAFERRDRHAKGLGGFDLGQAAEKSHLDDLTRTRIDGFERLPFYPGYSANFFDGKHFVMKGGGPRTALPLLRASFRNWFQPHYPHVHAAFRCVEE